MKFIHVSQVNLFAPDLENRRGIRTSEDRFNDFRKLLETCNREAVDLLFITGNLFYGAPDEKMLSYVDEAFGVLDRTRVFYVLGPNEGAEAERIANYPFRRPVKVFTGNSIERVYLPKLSVEIQGVGYSERTWNRTEIRELSPGKKGSVQVFLLPKDLPDVRQWPFHYVGAGGNEIIEGSSERRLYAPGSFEPETFEPFTKHGFFVGEFGALGRNVIGPSVRFQEGAAREYVLLDLSVSPEESLKDVVETVKKAIVTDGTQHLYKVRIRGVASISLSEGMDELFSIPEITGVENETKLEDTFSAIADSGCDDAVGRFLRDMLEREPSEGRDLAIRYGLQALTNATEEEHDHS